MLNLLAYSKTKACDCLRWWSLLRNRSLLKELLPFGAELVDSTLKDVDASMLILPLIVICAFRSSFTLFVFVPCLPAQSCLTLCDPLDCSPPGSSIRKIYSGKNPGVGHHFLLQGIFLTQINPHFLYLKHYRWILYPLSYLGSPQSVYMIEGPGFIKRSS